MAYRKLLGMSTLAEYESSGAVEVADDEGDAHADAHADVIRDIHGD